jgi:hypothetical protein
LFLWYGFWVLVDYGGGMVDIILAYVIKHHILTALVFVVVVIILYNLKTIISYLSGLLRKAESVKLPGFELKLKEELNSKNPNADKLIHGMISTLVNIEETVKKDAEDRIKRQEEVDKRMSILYEYIRETTVRACLAIISSEKIPVVEYFDTLFLYLKLGGNGSTPRMATVFIMKNDALGIFNSTLRKFREAEKKAGRTISANFEKAIKEIEDYVK